MVLGERITIQSPLPLDEVRARLADEVEPEGRILGPVWDRRTDRDRDFVGQVSSTSFSIRRRRRLLGPHRGANPRAWGTFERSPDSGTLITATFPRDIWQRILLVPVVLVAVAYIIATSDPTYRAVEVALLVAIVLIGVAPGGLGKRQIRELLEDVATPKAPSEPWRPYAARDRADS
jgi:hypothetical protein